MKIVIKRETRALLTVAGSAILCVVLYFGFILRPLWRKSISSGRELKDSHNKLEMLNAATSNKDALEKQYAHARNRVKSLELLLPGQEELPVVIEQLSTLASASGVTAQTIFPQRPAKDDQNQLSGAAPQHDVYTSVSIQIDALSGYHELGLYLNRIEANSRPLTVQSLYISEYPKETKRHRVKLVVRAYFSSENSSDAIFPAVDPPNL